MLTYLPCISLWQPWATLIVLGEKHYETRGWSTPLRGKILIHAAKKWDQENRFWFHEKTFYSVLHRHGYKRPEDLPLGAIIGGCTIADCVPTEDLANLTDQEAAFGDFGPGRFAWRIEKPKACRPVPARGFQKLFTVQGDLLQLVLGAFHLDAIAQEVTRGAK